jgi:hypothetical protein
MDGHVGEVLPLPSNSTDARVHGESRYDTILEYSGGLIPLFFL